MCRKTEMPELKRCPKSPGRLLKWHRWEYRRDWNGNDPRVLPFVATPYGLMRSGWRCSNCGRFVWDQSDQEYAASMAVAMGYVKLPTASVDR